MTEKDAIAILLDIASRWGENAEEGFSRRIEATDSDETCRQIASLSKVEPEEVIEVRNLWRAVAVLSR